MCVLCQNYDGVGPLNPVIKRGTKRENTGYVSLANNIETLHKLCHFPFDIELIVRVANGSRFIETLIKKKAC